MDNRAVEFADRYWAEDYFGMPLTTYRAAGVHVIAHGGDLVGYHGVFILRRTETCVVSCPVSSLDWIARKVQPGFAGDLLNADVLRRLIPDATTFVGPARVSYLNEGAHLADASGAALISGAALLQCLTELQRACEEQAWQWSGLGSSNEFMVGCQQDGQLVAAAGYERWGVHLAHIGVVTHPDFRGQGLGRVVVREATGHALQAQLVPQYRTLAANVPAIHLGESLGFVPYAETMAVRLAGRP